MIKRTVSEVLAGRGRRIRWRIILLFTGLLALQAGAFALVIGLIWGEAVAFWLPELLIGSGFLLAGGVLVLIIVSRQQRQTADLISRAAVDERHSYDMAHNQAIALQALAAAVTSARDVGGLLDIAVDIYQLVLNDLGILPEDQISVIYLLDGDHLSAAAARGSTKPGSGDRLDRHQGISGRVLAQAEVSTSEQPAQDPALSGLAWLQHSRQVICLPLCTAHGLFGLVLLALKQALVLSANEQGLLESIAEQVALGLHNFQLRHDLELTRAAALREEEGERAVIRQALWDGPSRDLAGVASRLSLIQSMTVKDPGQAAHELGKVEAQTRHIAAELGDLVTLLRPLDLEVRELNRALETTLRRIEGESGLILRIGRRATDVQLSQQVMAVVLYVLEGSLTWARSRGQARVAEVSYWSEGDRYHLSIDDDGYGQVQDGGTAISREDDLATLLMRAKVERAGGRLEVTSKPGRGVSTVLVAPLNRYARQL